ncbi:MAG: alkaline phosphatase PhoX [Nostocoides sp.]
MTGEQHVSRRGFVAAGAVGAATLGMTAGAAASPTIRPGRRRPAGYYGSLVEDPQGLLDLPVGFGYSVLAASGNSGNPIPATTLDDGGELSPSRYDGTGSFAGRDGGWVLVSSHECGRTASAGVPHRAGITYDVGTVRGGTTSITVDPDGRRIREVVSLAGTYANCAGGVTPWRTWLTCEETEQLADPGHDIQQDHGYVFEVRPHAPTNPDNARPIKAFGRFPHEALVVDPSTGYVYESEDAGGPNGLLYRWRPGRRSGHRPGRTGFSGLLERAGILEAMYALDGGTFVPDLSVYSRVGTRLSISWKTVPDRDARTRSTRKQFNYLAQDDGGAFTVPVSGPAGDVTRAHKLEGMWWGKNGFYVDSSFARPRDGSSGTHDGQIWFYDARRSTLTLMSYYPATTNPTVDPDGPDNLTVNPRGGLVVCEDGVGSNHLVLDDLRGHKAVFARNRQNSEMAGANFSPDGAFLFANSQDPGVVFAIAGPW